MSLKIIVLAKQVPDTRNVGKDAMKEDGTVNRAALPAIFNPEDLNALEAAIRSRALPATTGFFFGNYPPDDDSDNEDMQFIAKAREAINEGYAVYYDSWW